MNLQETQLVNEEKGKNKHKRGCDVTQSVHNGVFPEVNEGRMNSSSLEESIILKMFKLNLEY